MKFFNKIFATHLLTFIAFFSGGVGSNKVLAKLACGLHKPNAVTALTRVGFYRLSHRIPFRDISGFGKDLGSELNTQFGDLTVQKMRTAVLRNYADVEERLRDPERAKRAIELLFGVCFDPVKDKLMNNGLNCGQRNLSKLKTILHLHGCN